MTAVLRCAALCVLAVLAACEAEKPEPNVQFGSALLRVAVPVRDLETSKHFYSHALGFEPGFEGDITSPWVSQLMNLEAGQTVRFVILYGNDEVAAADGNSAMIGLMQVDNPALPSLQRPAGRSLVAGEGVLAMVTADVAAVEARLLELDATILFGPTESVDGSESELVFRDPDGVRIHVVQRHR